MKSINQQQKSGILVARKDKLFSLSDQNMFSFVNVSYNNITTEIHLILFIYLYKLFLSISYIPLPNYTSQNNERCWKKKKKKRRSTIKKPKAK